MEKQKIFKPLIIGIVGGLIVAGIITIIYRLFAPSVYTVQIIPLNSGQRIKIDSKVLQQQRPNQDGIIFIHITGSTKDYTGKLVVAVQAKDVPDWFRQPEVQPINGTFISRIQLGSREWPIRGGEGYLVKVSGSTDSAEAQISVARGTQQAH